MIWSPISLIQPNLKLYVHCAKSAFPSSRLLLWPNLSFLRILFILNPQSTSKNYQIFFSNLAYLLLDHILKAFQSTPKTPNIQTHRKLLIVEYR